MMDAAGSSKTLILIYKTNCLHVSEDLGLWSSLLQELQASYAYQLIIKSHTRKT
jgi:hypothetical protein